MSRPAGPERLAACPLCDRPVRLWARHAPLRPENGNRGRWCVLGEWKRFVPRPIGARGLGPQMCASLALPYVAVVEALWEVAAFSFEAVRAKRGYRAALARWCVLKRQARTALVWLVQRRHPRTTRRSTRDG